MADDNYLEAINEAQNLLTELLNDREHGKLTFKGRNSLDDLTITGPHGLNSLAPGAVLTIDGDEWMALTERMLGSRQWQCFAGARRASNEELYIIALKNADELAHCHNGLA